MAEQALVRRQEAELERLERRFDKINADADKADRRCGDDPDCLFANIRAYENATDRYFARADRVAERHDEEADWLIARMEEGDAQSDPAGSDGADGGSGGVTGEASVQASDLRVGECYDMTSDDFRDVRVVPCRQPHELEVFAVETVPTSVEKAERRCRRLFERSFGRPLGQSDLSMVFGFPHRPGAGGGAERTVICSVADPDGRPMRGAAPRPGR